MTFTQNNGCTLCGSDAHMTAVCPMRGNAESKDPIAYGQLTPQQRLDVARGEKLWVVGYQDPDDGFLNKHCKEGYTVPVTPLDDAQRLLAQRDAEIDRLKSAAPVVSDVIHHAFSRDRNIGWNAPAAEQALRALFEEWLKRSQFTRPNSPWDIWKACAKALESQKAASLDAAAERNAMQRQRDDVKKLLVRECGDADELVRLLGLDPESVRTDGGFLNLAKVRELQAASVGGERECTCPTSRGAGKPGLCPIHDARYIEQQKARAALSPAGGGVVMPEPMTISAEASGFQNGKMVGWNACLDEVSRLNAKPQANSQEVE